MIPWYNDHTNLATLWEWLEEIGATPNDSPAYFMEKPWKWNREYDAMLHVKFSKAPLNSTLAEVLDTIDELQAWA